MPTPGSLKYIGVQAPVHKFRKRIALHQDIWNRKIMKYTWAVHKETKLFFFFLLYLQLNQTCLLQSTPLHSRYTAPNVFSSSGTRPGTCFAGWREGPISNFLLSSIPSEISELLVRISTSGTRKSPQGPNLESKVAGGQQSSHASSKICG